MEILLLGPKIFLILYPFPEFFTTDLTINSNEDLEADDDTDIYHVSPNVPRQVYIASRQVHHMFSQFLNLRIYDFFHEFSFFVFLRGKGYLLRYNLTIKVENI